MSRWQQDQSQIEVHASMVHVTNTFKTSSEVQERKLQRRKEKAIERYMDGIDTRARLAVMKEAIARGPKVLATRVSRLAGAAKAWLLRRISTTRGHAGSCNATQYKGGHVRANQVRKSRHARASKDIDWEVQDPALAFTTGIARLEHHDFTGAVAFFTTASTLDPGWVMPLYVLARVYHDAGLLDEAIGWCQRALEVDPALTIARDMLECVLWRHACMKEGEPTATPA